MRSGSVGGEEEEVSRGPEGGADKVIGVFMVWRNCMAGERQAEDIASPSSSEGFRASILLGWGCCMSSSVSILWA